MSGLANLQKVVAVGAGAGSKTKKIGRSVVLVAAKRTPVGAFHGTLSKYSAPALGSIAVRGCLESVNLDPGQVEELYFGNVLQAGVGQAPARQVALGAGMKDDTPCTTINKVCASGMKSVMLAAQSIALGDRDVMVAGGMEAMSQTPHYLRIRKGAPWGPVEAQDAIQFDGLFDVYTKELMGKCTERVVEELGISRKEQDDFSITSYERARKAQKEGLFRNEIVSVEDVKEDEECQNFKPEKFSQLRAVFEKDGTITAANASKINDGAVAILLMAEEEAKARGLEPIARILGFDDAAVTSYQFGIAPSKAVNKLLAKLGMNINDIHYHEINEAFSAVAIANMMLLGIQHDQINVNGGGVALGHPIGASGARIILSLANVLKQKDATIGMASICNGGGGASAITIERIN